VEGGLLLDVVVRESAAVLELLSGENETLLIRWNSLLVLNLGLHIVDGIRRLNIKGDSLTSEGLYEDLHTSTKPQNKVESGLLLDVVIRESTAVLELLSSKDKTLLIWRDSLLVLNLSLHIVDGIRWLNIKGDRLTREGLYENLHTSTKPQNKVKGGLLLDVVVGEGAAILELLSSKDKTLLIWWDSFLILDLGLDIVDGVGWLNIKGDGLAGQGLDEDLHTSAETKYQVKGGLLLDVVIREGAAVL